MKQKVEELESTIDRLNQRLEKNQKKHELEMKETQNMLETLKQAGTITQLSYQNTEAALENARKEYQKNKERAKSKKVDLGELEKELEELQKKQTF